MKVIEIHGHRGCRGLYPENTLPGFKKAVDLGVDAIEMDLAVTKNNEIIVSHEPFISRKICLDEAGKDIPLEDDMKHNLYRMSFAEIKKFDCGLKFHPVFPHQQKIKTYKPLLTEVFETIEKGTKNIRYSIEVKSKPDYDNIFTPAPETFISLILKIIKEHHVFERCNLQSFDLRILEEIKRQAPKMKVALLIDANEAIKDKLKKLSYKPEIISPYYQLINSKDQIKRLQELNYRVIPWTVNSVSDMQRLIEYAVNGIITDYPDQLLKLIR